MFESTILNFRTVQSCLNQVVLFFLNYFAFGVGYIEFIAIFDMSNDTNNDKNKRYENDNYNTNGKQL